MFCAIKETTCITRKHDNIRHCKCCGQMICVSSWRFILERKTDLTLSINFHQFLTRKSTCDNYLICSPNVWKMFLLALHSSQDDVHDLNSPIFKSVCPINSWLKSKQIQNWQNCVHFLRKVTFSLRIDTPTVLELTRNETDMLYGTLFWRDCWSLNCRYYYGSKASFVSPLLYPQRALTHSSRGYAPSPWPKTV